MNFNIGLKRFQHAKQVQESAPATSKSQAKANRGGRAERPIMNGLNRFGKGIGNLLSRRSPQGESKPSASQPLPSISAAKPSSMSEAAARYSQSSNPHLNAAKASMKEQAINPNQPQESGGKVGAQGASVQMDRLVNIGIATVLADESKEDSVMGTLNRALKEHLKEHKSAGAKHAYLNDAKIVVKSNRGLTDTEKHVLTNRLDSLMLNNDGGSTLGSKLRAETSIDERPGKMTKTQGDTDKRANQDTKSDGGSSISGSKRRAETSIGERPGKMTKTQGDTAKPANQEAKNDGGSSILGSKRRAETSIDEHPNKMAKAQGDAFKPQVSPQQIMELKSGKPLKEVMTEKATTAPEQNNPVHRNYDISTPISDKEMQAFENEIFEEDKKALSDDGSFSGSIEKMDQQTAALNEKLNVKESDQELMQAFEDEMFEEDKKALSDDGSFSGSIEKMDQQTAALNEKLNVKESDQELMQVFEDEMFEEDKKALSDDGSFSGSIEKMDQQTAALNEKLNAKQNEKNTAQLNEQPALKRVESFASDVTVESPDENSVPFEPRVQTSTEQPNGQPSLQNEDSFMSDVSTSSINNDEDLAVLDEIDQFEKNQVELKAPTTDKDKDDIDAELDTSNGQPLNYKEELRKTDPDRAKVLDRADEQRNKEVELTEEVRVRVTV